MYKLLVSLVVTGCLYQGSFAQSITTPAPSSHQTVKQELGLSSVELTYSRPGVKGRKIFGDLVPLR
jgi:hypothetical protein